MKNKKFKLLIATLIFVCSFAIGRLVVEKFIVKANKLIQPQLSQDQILRKDIMQFNKLPLDKIIFNKDMTLNNKKAHELYDDNYFYHVYDDGKLFGIVSRNCQPKIGVTLSDNDVRTLKTSAYNILKQFNKENYNLYKIDNTLNINGMYDMDFVERNNKGILTGSSVSISLSSDGQLEWTSITYEDSSIANKPIKTTEDQAISIAFNLLNNDNTLKTYINTNNLVKAKDHLSLTKGQYITERNTYNGNAVWEITVKSDVSNESFTWVINAITGKVILNPSLKSVVAKVTNPNAIK